MTNINKYEFSKIETISTKYYISFFLYDNYYILLFWKSKVAMTYRGYKSVV